ncbi:hypothetical protein QFC19_001954 [Naganishia cerealis]|uniref:Uncharacterized protein n=1 Tax=Naganishia cerealis TaxID=610337 RepID=A0ACC2WEV9_9TREE|nr:hypothetical protein QFC19_001954 [Naganishia cerealis]
MSFEKAATFACNPATARLTSVKLGCDPKGEKIVYVNGRTVVIRDLSNPTKSVTYSQHTHTTTVARISPSGYYCASADVAGNGKHILSCLCSIIMYLKSSLVPTVRIWDIAGSDQVLKLAVRPLGGRVNDLSWDGESKRIIAVGDGRERFGAAFLADSGSSCGEIQGNSKVINAVSIRNERPFRAATASDDGAIVFFHGVPFKNDKTGETLSDIDAHNGSIVSVLCFLLRESVVQPYNFYSWPAHGVLTRRSFRLPALTGLSNYVRMSELVPVTRRLKIFSTSGDIETKQATTTFTIGSDVASQQNGNIWASENAVVSLSFDGTLNVFDPRDDKSWRKIYASIMGPTKAVTASALLTKPEPTFFTGSFDGSVRAFELPSGQAYAVEGQSGEGQISGMAADEDTGDIWASTWTDGQGLARLDKKAFSSNVRLDASLSAPKDVAAAAGVVVLADSQGMAAFKDGKKIKSASAKDGYSAVAVKGDLVAYGGADKKVHLESISSADSDVIFDDNRGEVISLTFSPDGKLLAAGDSSGRIVLIDVFEKKVRTRTHVLPLWFLNIPDGLRLVSGGLDESIYVHHVEQLLKKVAITVSNDVASRLLFSSDDGRCYLWNRTLMLVE